ncbi:MAG: peroxiredoxin [Gemmataceae bacterium]
MTIWTRALATVTLVGIALTARAADKPLAEGTKAPDVELKAVQLEKALPDMKDAKTFKLADFKNKKNVVLFFYPKAMTSGCTKESCGFRDVYADLAKHDTVVIGISTDNADDQKKFIDKEHLNFPLIADPEKKATQAFGALNERGMAFRYTFVIDKTGVIRKTYLKVDPNKHPPEVLEFVKSMK